MHIGSVLYKKYTDVYLYICISQMGDVLEMSMKVTATIAVIYNIKK